MRQPHEPLDDKRHSADALRSDERSAVTEQPCEATAEELGPVAAWFLGPKAEHAATWQELLGYVFADYIHWRRNVFPGDPVVISRELRRADERWLDEVSDDLDLILSELKAHYPFYHPRYLAHMLSEQTLPSVLGYFAGMLYNPNNVTEEAAPVTVRHELEVGGMVAEMLGYKRRRAWAHITSGGTVANIEALWTARTAQFVPLILRDLCKRQRLPFTAKTPDGEIHCLRDLDDPKLLVHFQPNECILMPRKLARYLVEERETTVEQATAAIEQQFAASPWNPARRGFAAVAAKLGLRPLVFASAAAHYSLAKACNLLGYGEDALQLIPVSQGFRVDVDALADRLRNREADSYIAAVVGILGTTEQGAVDPIHRLQWLRNELAREQRTAFWLHVDAAWGGYVASLFRGRDIELRKDAPLTEVARAYGEAINAREKLVIPVEAVRAAQASASGKAARRRVENQTSDLRWGDEEVYAAFLAIEDADSITVDPHKLGYVPYPAGVVAFRNGLVTELAAQKANYISKFGPRGGSIDEPVPIDAVGPYILEGSKPGAAAAACWLAHTTIPLVASGHGRIVRGTLMGAAKLARYVDLHRHLYPQLERAITGHDDLQGPAFTFLRLFSPDTNIVCFVARPMAVEGGRLIDVDVGLERLNGLNRRVHERMGEPAGPAGERMPYGHPFFVSRTRFEHTEYSAESINDLLSWIGVTADEYRQHDLFVLRSVVMNPHYQLANQHAHQDYLMAFVRHLHEVTRQEIRAMGQ